MMTRMRATGVAAVLTAAAMVVAPAGSARGADGMQLDNPIPGQLVGGATAPTWLKEGVRLSYESSFAAAPAKPGEVGAAGAGIMQIDVVAVTPDKVGVAFTNWAKNPLDGTITFLNEVGSVTKPGGQADGFWLHPAELMQVAEAMKNDKAFAVGIGPVQIGDRQFQAVRFQRDSETGRTVSTFDKDTGILLMYLHSEKAGGNLKPRHVIQFMGLRERKLPWNEGRPPQWILKIQGVRYDGAMVTQIQGVPPFQQRATVMGQTTERGLNWMAMKLSMSVDGQNFGEGVKMSGPSQIGGLWLPPLALRGLQQGQVLDRDPVTGVTTSVMFVGQGAQHGRQCVTIDEQGPAYRRVTEYEASTGILLGIMIINPALNQTTQLWFTGIQ